MSEPPLTLSIDVATREVEFGKAFALTVVRSWARPFEPDPWTDALLAPLVVRRLAIATRTDGPRTIETRRYDAYPFQTERLIVPAIEVRAVAPSRGQTVTARAESLTFRVHAAQRGPAGDRVELPCGLVPIPRPGRSMMLALGAGSAACAAWILRRRMRRGTARDAARAPTAVARDRLRELRGVDPTDRATERSFHVEVAAILRQHAAPALGIATDSRTTDELFRVHPGWPELRDCLERCDAVKFAPVSTTHEQRTRLLDAAVAILDTQPEA